MEADKPGRAGDEYSFCHLLTLLCHPRGSA
jgi:hypothetical protein